MRIAILSKEYPPYVYGGAGVHVQYLVRELAKLSRKEHQLEVLCFGDQDIQEENLEVRGVEPRFDFPAADPRHTKVFQPLLHSLVMSGRIQPPDVVHCHTWYTHFAGCLIKELFQAPLVLTTHSLEPHRPWKQEQLGSGYYVSTWLEKTAFQHADRVIAVSKAMQADVQDLYQVPSEKIRIIPNGIDPQEYQPKQDLEVLGKYGLNPEQPYIIFVGRITRQKGILHLVRSIPYLQKGAQVLLCASSPDTPELGRQMQDMLDRAKGQSPNPIIWVQESVPQKDLVPLYSQAAAFICPSIYEPFGIVNLEAMSCGTPVVASQVGGIPEILDHGHDGYLVPLQPVSQTDAEPRDPDGFSQALAKEINKILADPEDAQEMGQAARDKVLAKYSWQAVASQTLELYHKLQAGL
ncbi:MAG: glycogen synthase [Desulfohalobiaceae bacterium]